MKTAIISVIAVIILGVVGLVGYKMFGKHSNPPTAEEINIFCKSWADKFGKMTKKDGYFDGKKYHFIFSTEKIPHGDLDLLKTEKGWTHYDSDEIYSCIVPR
jgi:hypothetical protein